MIINQNSGDLFVQQLIQKVVKKMLLTINYVKKHKSIEGPKKVLII